MAVTRHSPSGRHALGLSLAGLAVFQWGTQPVLQAIVVRSLEVTALGWMRFAVTAALLLPMVLRRGGPELLRLRGRRLLLLAVCVAGLLCNYLTFMAALRYVSPGTAQVVIQLAPMLMLLGGLFLFGEPFSRLQWLGIALLIGGLALFFSPRYGGLSGELQGFGIGMLLLIISAVAWAVYLLSQKQLLTVLPPQAILLPIYATGTILLLPVVRFADYGRLDPVHLGLLAATSLLTFTSYLCYAHAAEHVEASRIGLLLSLSPVVVFGMAGLSSLLLPDLARPEELSLTSIGGAALVVAGSMLGAMGSQSAPGG